MGATTFLNYGVARTAQEAYDKLVQDALYWHGHGGYTGTIAEKAGFKEFGQINSMQIDNLVDYLESSPSAAPKTIRDSIRAAKPVYEDKWGPAVCFEVTGTRAKEIKEHAGRKGTWDKVYVFCGWASE